MLPITQLNTCTITYISKRNLITQKIDFIHYGKIPPTPNSE